MAEHPQPPRREILAFIALADAPMPKSVSFVWGTEPAISLTFDTQAAALRWSEITGIVLTGQYTMGKWRGCMTWITAPDQDPTSSLDDATREKLQAISGEVTR